MKKIVFLLIAVIVVLLFVSACGEEQQRQENKQSDPIVYDLTTEESGYLDVTGLELKYGKIESIAYNNYDNDATIVVKAIVNESSRSRAIDANYQNAVQLIRENGLHACNEFQYWSVSEMSNGEQKSMSFTLDKDTIDKIYNKSISDGDIEKYAKDVWVNPAL